ncbi:hypothetical protein GCM10011571_19360 [Marinithermofilum abyssi]|uniref:Uncharacterized protein n=1 Tax=Marinithermofilum abyssi TaxID=1571185 RepID=A0A8J2YDJ4_9BACL|nr:CDP-glycerol glycerophosphotransferase family protein [Marinithermofilum abyssi]GGE17741.1 hypothetical protein GCM10011571_19360 [Marinithermofilum abyssi]
MAGESYVISTSEKVSSYYPETFLVNRGNVWELGQARNDLFFTETDEEKHFPNWIKERKIITYMPTHRNFGQLDKEIHQVLDLKRLDEFCRQYGCTFLIKRHMFSKGKLPRGLEHVVDISQEKLEPQLLLKYTDILVTDYSSCYTDYLLLNRPVLFYCYDLDEYLTKSNEMYHDYEEVTPGPKVETFDALLKSLAAAAEGRDAYEAERNRVLHIFYARENQGPVAEKQVRHIYKQILRMDPSFLEREGVQKDRLESSASDVSEGRYVG